MRLKISLAASAALAALLLAACNPQDSSAPAANSGGRAANQPAAKASAKPPAAATPQAAAPDGVRRIGIQEARAAVDGGQAVFIDVRNEESYAAGHIRGARVVAYDQVERHLAEFPKDKLIITYCA